MLDSESIKLYSGIMIGAGIFAIGNDLVPIDPLIHPITLGIILLVLGTYIYWSEQTKDVKQC